MTRTINEAIEIKQNNSKRYSLIMTSEEVEAEGLGIEALKLIKYIRTIWPGWIESPLSGETQVEK